VIANKSAGTYISLPGLPSALSAASGTLNDKEVCMRIHSSWLAAFALLIVSSDAAAQSVEDEIVLGSAQVLREIMAIPARGIPESLMKQAYGLAIIPGMVKGGFVIGIKHGKGVIVTRDENNAWRGPSFITATGGSVGWQVGLQSTDVILVFRNRRGVEGLLRGKLTIGVDASVAAGPVGRDAAAATDLGLKAEILSYSRSRGLFAGAAIDGAIIQPDERSNAAYYGQPGQLPASALKLLELVAAYTGTTAPVVRDNAQVLAPPQPVDEREALRRQLAESSKRLQVDLDPQWRQYLALPQEIYSEGKSPTTDVLETFVARYNKVAVDRQYQELISRPEFQETHTLLNRYYSTLRPRDGALKLPPPPPQ